MSEYCKMLLGRELSHLKVNARCRAPLAPGDLIWPPLVHVIHRCALRLGNLSIIAAYSLLRRTVSTKSLHSNKLSSNVPYLSIVYFFEAWDALQIPRCIFHAAL